MMVAHGRAILVINNPLRQHNYSQSKSIFSINILQQTHVFSGLWHWKNPCQISRDIYCAVIGV
ncbi:Uncharacterised protein [Mycobacteroides abscessus subsp. abscessus]|nr:Uncharacterised protein [Mycobacteroides abscessus subsp. abscessus]